MIATVSTERLAAQLVDAGRISAAQMADLNRDSRRERKTVFDLIMERDLMKQSEVIDFLCDQLKIPSLNLQAYHIPKSILGLVPKKIVERYKILPLSKIGNLLTIISSNPFDIMLLDDIRGVTLCEVALVLATPAMIQHAIENYFSEIADMDEILDGMDEDELEVIREKQDEAPEEGRASTDDAPVVRMVNLILDGAIRARASDIHFEPYEKDFRVRYRVDGALQESFSHSKEMYQALVARLKIMSQLDITEKRVPQDGRFRARIKGHEVDFRVSVLPTYFGEKVVLRVLDKSGVKQGLDKLGFSERPTQAIADAIQHPYGMVLVTGPTGSGKSTTLYTVLGTLNTPERNIMTIEDPVEYQVEGITQTQVQSEIGLTFASGLRCLLRQSPDIVLVGEIRDSETADIAVKAALTGHLVFSTLHTNSAAGAVTRLIDMGVEPFLIASSVIAVAAQRLMKRICQYCKVEYVIPADVLRRCKISQEELKGITAYKGKGCAKCNDTGYFGRIGAIEVLTIDPEIRDLIIQRKASNVIHEVAVRKGMETLYENAIGLFKKGVTTLDEVLRVSSNQ